MNKPYEEFEAVMHLMNDIWEKLDEGEELSPQEKAFILKVVEEIK
jgi:hypothetical protein